MAIPATTGQLRTSVLDMQIGDYIACNYTAGTSGAVGTFSNLGGTAGTEIQVTASATPNGTFYHIKVDRGLLIADRVVQFSVTWDALNTGKVIQGLPTTLITGGVIRSLTGGVAYTDANGNSSTTDQSKGAWPANNEWDKYILNFPIYIIQSGKVLDDVFHWRNLYTWVQDTPITAIAANTHSNYRGMTNAYARGNNLSNTSSTQIGFRPVFQYLE